MLAGSLERVRKVPEVGEGVENRWEENGMSNRAEGWSCAQVRR
jgi:hypothetical protein